MPQKMELSQNLFLCRSDNGVKLLPLSNLNQLKNKGFVSTGFTLKKLMELPFNIYFLDRKGETLQMNGPCIEICGFKGRKESIGKSLFDVSHQASANELINNCTQTIAENKIRIFEEENLRNDGVTLRFLSVKSPWYDEENNIIGIFGCSIVLGEQSLAQSLIQIITLGLLDPACFTLEQRVVGPVPTNEDDLSERENMCVYHLCNGLTNKEIAKITELSPRTVETYVNRAKQKLHCKNKAELIKSYLDKTNGSTH